MRFFDYLGKRVTAFVRRKRVYLNAEQHFHCCAGKQRHAVGPHNRKDDVEIVIGKKLQGVCDTLSAFQNTIVLCDPHAAKLNRGGPLLLLFAAAGTAGMKQGES